MMKNQSACPNVSTRISFRKIAALIPIYLFFAVIGPAHLSAQEQKQSISDAIKGFAENRKRMRLAVFDFVNTAGQKTQYDGYIADTIISELSKYSLTLLERKRLKLLLKEHALSQLGVVDSAKALKMGMLLPVDVIVSGSYTQIGSKVIVNGRFIHVGSGEILYAFAASINTEASGSAKKDTKPVCDPIWEPVVNALKNLKDEETVNNAATVAVSIPFDNSECGKIHYKIMYAFSSAKKYPKKYSQFLLETLASIDDPADDKRTMEIFRYFAADKTVDVKEWQVMLSAFKKWNNYALHIPLSPMLNSRYEKANTVQKRIDDIMRLTESGKIGRPVSVTEERMFFSILYGIGANSIKDVSVPVYMFKKYQKILPDTEEHNKKAAGFLERIYLMHYNRNTQKAALEQLIGFYRSREKTPLLANEIIGTIRTIESKINDRYGLETKKKAYFEEDLKVINTSLAELICYAVAVARNKGYKSQIEDRIEYVLKTSIPCEYAPTIRDLENDMRSGDWDRKLKAIELLAKIGMAAKPAEQTVIKYLGQQGFGYNGGKLRRLCALTLGNINTTDPTGIKLLIESFPDYNNGVSQQAKDTIKKIGMTALPYLIEGLDHEHHAVRYGCAEALGNLGRKAKGTVAKLEEIAEKDKDPYVRRQAKGAVQMIKNDF